MAWVLLMALVMGPTDEDLRIDPTDPVQQQALFLGLRYRLWGGPDGKGNTCQSTLFDNCTPVLESTLAPTRPHRGQRSGRPSSTRSRGT